MSSAAVQRQAEIDKNRAAWQQKTQAPASGAGSSAHHGQLAGDATGDLEAGAGKHGLMPQQEPLADAPQRDGGSASSSSSEEEEDSKPAGHAQVKQTRTPQDFTVLQQHAAAQVLQYTGIAVCTVCHVMDRQEWCWRGAHNHLS